MLYVKAVTVFSFYFPINHFVEFNCLLITMIHGLLVIPF